MTKLEIIAHNTIKFQNKYPFEFGIIKGKISKNLVNFYKIFFPVNIFYVIPFIL